MAATHSRATWWGKYPPPGRPCQVEAAGPVGGFSIKIGSKRGSLVPFLQEEPFLTDIHAGGSSHELEVSLRVLRPPLLLALFEDARMFRYHRGEPLPPNDKAGKWLNLIRLLFEADDFAAVALYRARTALMRRGLRGVPRLFHFVSMALFQVRIGDFVVLGEGAYIPHGNVVIDGITVIGRRCVLAPWTTLGVVQGSPIGPKLEDGVFVGTGAKVLGRIVIGANARIGANSVVVSDVPAGATAIGVPAKVTNADGEQQSSVVWPEDAAKV